MKRKHLIIAALLATTGAITTSAVVHARYDGYCQHGSKHHSMSDFGGKGGMGGMHRMLRGLDLSDEQEDKIFEIMHAQQPKAREKKQLLRKSRQELHAATMTTKYNARTVRKLAETHSQLMADLIVMHAETGNKIYALLTPEQQQQLLEKQERRKQRSGAKR